MLLTVNGFIFVVLVKDRGRCVVVLSSFYGDCVGVRVDVFLTVNGFFFCSRKSMRALCSRAFYLLKVIVLVFALVCCRR